MVSHPESPCAKCKARVAELEAKVEARDRELGLQAKAAVALGTRIGELEANLTKAGREIAEATSGWHGAEERVGYLERVLRANDIPFDEHWRGVKP